ncbi:MAG TPA: ADOP family duplicated permease [Terracidiphilus sp.]|jgi:predicted permease|nr:ADOP family duplicated permease [Terracidiphilus sp.]
MSHLLLDLRYAVRQLRRASGFTLAAVLTLALGIASLTTVFTWIKAVLFDPYPHVVDPRSLRFVDATVRESQGYNVRYDVLRFLRERDTSLENSAAFTLDMLDLASPGAPPEALSAGLVSSNYFEMLGLKPQIGQFFAPAADDRAYGSHDEVVLSDREWRVRFNADPQIVGRAISINRHPFTIIGVGPRDFAGIYGGIGEGLWVPLSATRSLQPDPAADPLKTEGLMIGGRLRPGISSASASVELHTLARSYAQEQEARGSNMGGWDLNLRDSAHFERGLFGTIGENMPVLLGAAVLLLILVCINTASLLGQRAIRRRREIAIRTSLGATSRRIAAQLFAEALLLAVLGGAVGWAASLVFAQSLYALMPNFGLPLSFNFSTDWRILGEVAALVMMVALLCGMMPIRQALRSSQKEAMHEGGQGVLGAARNRWAKIAMLGVQLGLCFVMLVSSALLMRTALNVIHRARGFDRENCLTAQFSLSRSGYTTEKGLALQTALLDELHRSSAVRGVTLTSHLPMGDWGSGNVRGYSIPGYTPAKNEGMDLVTDFEGPEFFKTMGIAMAQGREFTAQDREGAPLVAVVNEDMARRYWPKGNAMGSTVVMDKQAWQIVGIVKDYAYHNPQDTDPSPLVFIPILQQYQSDVFVAVRSRTTAEGVVPVLKQAVGRLDSALPLENVMSLKEVGDVLYQFSRVPVELLGVFALASLLVATLGLYSAMAYAVTERNREFALRMAVGATRLQIVKLVMNGGLETAAAGLVVGGVGAFFAIRLLRSMLFGVAPFDPVSFAGAAAVLVLTVLVAGLLPARRAAAIEPMQALRTE